MQNGFWKLAVMAGVIAVCLVVVVQVNRQLSGDGALQAGLPAVEGDKVDLPLQATESETEPALGSSSALADAPTLIDPSIDEFGDAPPEMPAVSAPEPLSVLEKQASFEKGPSLASAPPLKPQALPADDFWGAPPRPVASGPGLDFRAVQAEPSDASLDPVEQSEPAIAVLPTSMETADSFEAASDPSQMAPALVPVAETVNAKPANGKTSKTDDSKVAPKLPVREVSATSNGLDLPGQLPTAETPSPDLVDTPKLPTPTLTPVPEEPASLRANPLTSGNALPEEAKAKFDDLVAAVPPSLRTRKPAELPTLTDSAASGAAQASGEKMVSSPGRATLKNEAAEAAGVVLVAGVSDTDEGQGEEAEVDPFADFAPSPAPAQVAPKPASNEADPFADPPALPELPSENPRPTANDGPPADPFDFAPPPAMERPNADSLAAPLEDSDKSVEEKPVPAPTDDPFDFGVEIAPKPARSSQKGQQADDFLKNDPAANEPDPFSAELGPVETAPTAELAPQLPTMLGDEPVAEEPAEDPAPARQRRPLMADDFPALPRDLDTPPVQPAVDPFGGLSDDNATLRDNAKPPRSSIRNQNLADEADPFPALDLPESTAPRPAPVQPTQESGLAEPPAISLGEPAPLKEPALPEPALPDSVLPQEAPLAREKPVRPMVVDFPKSDGSRPAPAPIQQVENQQDGYEGSGPREMSLEERTDQPRRLELFPEETPPPQKPVLTEIDFLGDGVVPETAVRGVLEPRLAIEKIAPTSAQLGQSLVYSVVVKNVGGSAAKQVTVEDRIPKGTRLTGTAPRAELIDKKLRWKLGDLAPGEERKISIRVIPESEGSIGSVATVNFVAEVAAEIMVTSPQLKLELEAPPQARINEPVNYKFRVTNTGNGDASQVLVRNILPETLQHPAGRDLEYSVGLLKAGESREVTLQLVPVKTGRITNTAKVTGDGGLDEQASVEVDVVGEALVLTRTAHDRVYVGRPAKITNTVANESPLSVEKIQISEMVPVGFEVVEASNAGQFDPATRTIVWAIGPVPAGHQQAVTATLVPKALGAHKGSVTAMGVSGSLATLNTAVDVIGIPALSVESPGDARIVAAGERVTIRLQVKNRGTGPANNLELKVDLPDTLELIDAKGPTSGGLEGTMLSFQPLKQLPAQGIALYELVLKTNKSGENRLDVEFIADHLSRAVHREELLQVIEQMQ